METWYKTGAHILVITSVFSVMLLPCHQCVNFEL